MDIEVSVLIIRELVQVASAVCFHKGSLGVAVKAAGIPRCLDTINTEHLEDVDKLGIFRWLQRIVLFVFARGRASVLNGVDIFIKLAIFPRTPK